MNVLIMDKDHYNTLNDSTRNGVVQMCHVVAIRDEKHNTYELMKSICSEKYISITHGKLKQILKETEDSLAPRLF